MGWPGGGEYTRDWERDDHESQFTDTLRSGKKETHVPIKRNRVTIIIPSHPHSPLLPSDEFFQLSPRGFENARLQAKLARESYSVSIGLMQHIHNAYFLGDKHP